jgi:uncharacterized YkwD family protein
LQKKGAILIKGFLFLATLLVLLLPANLGSMTQDKPSAPLANPGKQTVQEEGASPGVSFKSSREPAPVPEDWVKPERQKETPETIVSIENPKDAAKKPAAKTPASKPKEPDKPAPKPAPEPEPEPKPEPEPEPEPKASLPPYSMNTHESTMFKLVNEERAKEGLPALKLHEKLGAVARFKSQDMKDNNYFSHTSPTYGSPSDLLKYFDISWRAFGENLALHSSAEKAHAALMNSAGHRANILNANFTHVGIGMVQGSQGQYYTQIFIRP